MHSITSHNPMTADDDPHRDGDRTEYNTRDISVSDDSEFVGGNQIRGDQYNVGRDMYQTTEPEYEQNTTPFATQLFNLAASLFQFVGTDIATELYERINALPVRAALAVVMAVLMGVSILDLIPSVPVSIRLYYPLLVLPLVALMLPLLFTLTYDEYRCPQCGPFALRRVRKSIVDTSRFRVFYRCTECGGTFNEEMYTTEDQT